MIYVPNGLFFSKKFANIKNELSSNEKKFKLFWQFCQQVSTVEVNGRWKLIYVQFL